MVYRFNGEKLKMSGRKVAFIVLISKNSEESKELKKELDVIGESIKGFRCWKHIRTVIVDQ